MSVTTRSDPHACGTHADTRLRYVYGQRLTAVDLADEQAYLLGQSRFLAERGLGAGVVCGLRAERIPPREGHAPAVRVTAGAALDGCGRRIVVPGDHCLDVGAWYATNRDDLGWEEPGSYPAWIGLRHAEHPSHPTTVPRDPCGCDATSCAYGRVRDGFDLALHPATGPAEIDTRDDLLPHLCDQLAGAAPERVLTPAACPACRCDAWLLLAAVDVTVLEIPGGPGLRATAVSAPDHTDPRRRDLLSLEAVQRLATAVAGVLDGWCAAGPAVGEVSGDGEVDEEGALTQARLTVEVQLAADPAADGDAAPLAEATFDPDTQVRLAGLGGDGWEVLAADVTYDPDSRQIRLSTGDARLDTPYRLRIVSDPLRPVSDMRLRPLRPSPWSRTVEWRLADDTVTVHAHP